VRPSHPGRRQKAESGLFTGSAQAEERGKAFETVGDDADDISINGHDGYAATNGHAR
jgi:hypothetical protein